MEKIVVPRFTNWAILALGTLPLCIFYMIIDFWVLHETFEGIWWTACGIGCLEMFRRETCGKVRMT